VRLEASVLILYYSPTHKDGSHTIIVALTKTRSKNFERIEQKLDQQTSTILTIMENATSLRNHGNAETELSSSSDEERASAVSSSHRLHLVFVVDTTGSMQVYLAALKEALCQVTALLQILFPSSADVSVLTYEDYGDGKRLFRKVVQGSYRELSSFCSNLKPGGGADLAEASKTALNFLLSKMIRVWQDDTVVVFHYTDAPPHHKLTNDSGPNRGKEQRALLNQKPGFDWCKISKRFRKKSENVKLFTIVPESSPAGRCGSAFFTLLGELIAVPDDASPQCITQTTMSILMQLIGQEAQPMKGNQRVIFQHHDEVMERLMGDKFDEDSFPELNTDACKEPTVEPTKKNTGDLAWMEEYSFSAVPAIAKTDLELLRTSFKQDPDFRELVFQVMADLIQPHRVMALTTNPIFGRLWRLVCNARDDERLAGLVSRMGGCASSKLLSSEDQVALKIWIEDSYDYADEMNEKIKSQHSSTTRFYVLDTFAEDYVPSVDGLRSLARAPSPAALANLQKLLSHISVVTVGGIAELPVDEEGNCRYIPECMDDYQLFTMLPHLMRAGTLFSLKPAAVLAMVCCKSPDSLLEKRAHCFLVSIKGKWLPQVDRIDRAEIISYEFSSLIANCTVEGAFTEEERAFFVRLHEIWRYRRGRFTDFDVVTSLSPTKPMLLPDEKKLCRSCHEWTSISLLNGNYTCGICLWMQEDRNNKWTRPVNGDPYFVQNAESYIVECTKCTSMYAVLGPADLNVAPKCHYCRGLDKNHRAQHGAPYRRCGCCKAKWCIPSLCNNKNDESGAFVCPVCKSGGATHALSHVPTVSQATHAVSLQMIMDENSEAIVDLGFRKKAASIIFSGTKIYQAIVNDRPALFLPPRKDVTYPALTLKNKMVLNQTALIERVKETIASSTFVETCQLCFEEMAVEKLRPACGKCRNRCCQECLSSWYRQNLPGQLFIPCHDMCPFCRQRPQYRVLSQYNHQACGIIGHSRRNGAELRLRADWYYAWCVQCWKVGFAMERRCAEGVPKVEDFVCEECQEKNQMRLLEKRRDEETEEALTKILLENAKPCPGCQILTTHLGGCSHMTCTKCSCHWCWQCGVYQSGNGRDVYNHMSTVHRGYGWQD